jgi:hypothetical protein
MRSVSLHRTRNAAIAGPRLPRHRDEEPLRRLWLAVIKLAFRDVEAASRSVQRDAREFLGDHDRGLTTFARLAGLCPRTVRDKARRILQQDQVETEEE